MRSRLVRMGVSQFHVAVSNLDTEPFGYIKFNRPTFAAYADEVPELASASELDRTIDRLVRMAQAHSNRAIGLDAPHRVVTILQHFGLAIEQEEQEIEHV